MGIQTKETSTRAEPKINGETKRENPEKPLVSLLLSAYNEEAILEGNIKILANYLSSLEESYDWEIILVNDGSSDKTGMIGEKLAKENPKIKLFHHVTNWGLGKGLQTALEHCKGDYAVTFDVDLSMTPDHIGRLLQKISETQAKVVIASPMLKGGKLEGMPWYRKFLSICANKFLSFFAAEEISSLTSMVRVYDGEFIRSLNLRSMGMEIMPEILYKTMILQGQIEEIPASLVWAASGKGAPVRISKMKIFRHTLATIFTGFLLKPFLFFILPGMFLFLFSLYPVFWMFVHFFQEYSRIASGSFLDKASLGLQQAFELHPHTFLVAFFSLVLSIQLIAVGFLSLQNRYYYEETFNLLTRWGQRKNR